MQQAMQSTPSYATVLDDIPQALQYLIIVQNEKTEDVQKLYQGYQNIEKVIYLSAKKQLADAALDADIVNALQDAHIGLHAVVCGDEEFLWQVEQQLLLQGLIRAEIQLVKTQDNNRRIYCVHCFHLFSSTADEYCDCPQCATHLFIRSHFSERLGAYMGVSANAEDIRGEIA